MHSLWALYGDLCPIIGTKNQTRTKSRSVLMEDLLWIAVTVAFFALSIGYVHFCDRVK
jgi:hypothetical protein